jgi:hypothetical protein
LVESANTPWSDEELAGSVEAYVFLLRLHLTGVVYSKERAQELLLAGPLNIRNDASIRYRFRNISSVIAELGGPTLPAYFPANKVGRNVRERLRIMLMSHPGFVDVLEVPQSAKSHSPISSLSPRTEALARLTSLRAHLEDLERELLGLGHNQPPEPLSMEGPSRADFQRAREDISALEREVRNLEHDDTVVQEHSNRLLDFGLKVALWFGERATRFTDTALKILAPVVVAKATGIMPVIVDTISAVIRALH